MAHGRSIAALLSPVQKKKGGKAAQGKGIPEKAGSPMCSDPATTYGGFAGFVSVPDTKTMSRNQAWKGFPHALRTLKPYCRTSASQDDEQPNPAEKQGIENAECSWFVV